MKGLFHPIVEGWFREEVGTPTEAQRLAWPRIAAGEHVLVTAPTGSGKTLTAFLWALDRLLTGTWRGGRVRVLYVSPLKALNTDVGRNLERPLAALRGRFRAAGREIPEVRAMTRSGDTPQSERRRMLRQPPEILITTPESLNVLLTSQGGRSLLDGLETVILDEIHAVAGSKRGTHLITAVERLVPLSGEFQRLALSATVRPLETVADFVGGYERLDGDGAEHEPRYRKRPVSVVRSTAAKRYDVEVRFPPTEAGEAEEESPWSLLVADWKRVIRRNRSTLLFANSRRMTEKVTRLINEGELAELAYSHHGSLSREVRSVVEQRLKDGQLKAIVATSSLELGIDVGALDEVLLIQTPRAVASAIQRIGRAGHGVGEVSRGVIYPTHGRDFLDAAVVARAIDGQDIEAVRPIEAPLDVLAQVVLSMCAAESWHLDELYAQLRSSYPYRDLRRRSFDLVIEMLAGRYADSRVRELRPRLLVDRLAGTVRARPGVARLLYMAGGTIADRGYYALRLEETMAKIGELDEEFVWERAVGDTFSLGAQNWRIAKVTHNDVLVTPARGASAMAPFWRADVRDRGHHLSERIGRFLERADDRLEDPAFALALREEYHLAEHAAAELLDLLRRQKAATGGLPHRRHLVIEHVRDPVERGERQRVILHTFWGGKVNRPYALALAAAWDERGAGPLEVMEEDDCILLGLPHGVEVEEVLVGVDPERLELLLRRRLERTGYFGARFRLAASTALLLPRAGFRHRTPLWLSRQRSKKLLEAVSAYGDFPVLVETWRGCLQDGFELAELRRLLGEVARGEIRVSEVVTHTPSPFAANLVWKQTNTLMYEDDTPESGRPSSLRQDLLKELVFASHLRPRLPAALVEDFRRKAQRVAAGYAPRPGAELVDWLAERVLVAEAEWRELVTAVARDHELAEEAVVASAAERAAAVCLPGAEETAVVALEGLPRLLRALELEAGALRLGELAAPERDAPLGGELERLLALDAERRGEERREEEGRDEDDAPDLADLVAEHLRFYGPVEPTRLGRLWGLDEAALREVLELLRESERVVVDQLRRGAEEAEVCDVENLEVLLRWMRRDARPSFEALDAEKLPLFLALHQGVARPGAETSAGTSAETGLEDVRDRLEQLMGYPARAGDWEAEILPARLDPYYPAWLDSLMQEPELVWLGCGKEKLTFAFASDLDLYRDELPPDEGAKPAGEGAVSDGTPSAAELFPGGPGRYGLAELAAHTGRGTAEVEAALWRAAWRGEATNDGFAAVRQGVLRRFRPSEGRRPARRPASARRSSSRRRFDRWRSEEGHWGAWRRLEPPGEPLDALDREELAKDRIRVLLDRYGLLFRELLARELPPLQWGRVFRALRLMELSGELLAGHFFRGIRGLQFISHAAFKELRRGLPGDVVYWLNAIDPASLCAVDVEGLKGELPARKRSSHLVYHGERLVLVSERRGKSLDVRVPPDHPHLERYLEPLRVMLTRAVGALSSIEVETINGERALDSPYGEALGRLFQLTREQRSVKLWKRY